MVRRHVRSDFAADVFVFPGGKVDQADLDAGLSHYVRVAPIPHAPGVPEEWRWRGLEIAAIRELFEEGGVLLAYAAAGGLVSLRGDDQKRFASYRSELHGGRLSMLELALTEDLFFAADYLEPFAHWITPESFPRRFDTWFFVASLPEWQEPLHDRKETTDSIWIAPGRALELHQEGRFPLVFATERQLQRMAAYQSVDAMVAATTAESLAPVIPRQVTREFQTIFLIPGDEGYDESMVPS